MITTTETLISFALALGSGLLIGVERERRKGSGPQRRYAGVRTFALVALLGAGVQALSQPLLMLAAALLVVGLSIVRIGATARTIQALPPRLRFLSPFF